MRSHHRAFAGPYKDGSGEVQQVSRGREDEVIVVKGLDTASNFLPFPFSSHLLIFPQRGGCVGRRRAQTGNDEARRPPPRPPPQLPTRFRGVAVGAGRGHRGAEGGSMTVNTGAIKVQILPDFRAAPMPPHPGAALRFPSCAMGTQQLLRPRLSARPNRDRGASRRPRPPASSSPPPALALAFCTGPT